MKHVKLTTQSRTKLTEELLKIKALAQGVKKRYGVGVTVICNNGDQTVILADAETYSHISENRHA